MTAFSRLRVIAITDTERAPIDLWLTQLGRLARAAVPGSVQVLLRDRQLDIRDRQRFGQLLRILTREHGQLLSVSDRLDLAVLLSADAVHLSGASVAVEDARAFGQHHGQNWQITDACHCPGDVARSRADGLLLSPIAEPRKGRPALGALGLAAAQIARRDRSAELGPCSVYALGGVTRRNAAELVAAGADGVAVVGDLLNADAPSALVDALGLRR